MNADKLMQAAAIVDTSTAQASRILAAGMRQEARAANGMGTAATLQLMIALDNDRQHYERVKDITLDHCPDPGETNEQQAGSASKLADALREHVEEACGTEGVRVGPGDELYGDATGFRTLSPIMLAMIRVALCDVDWIRLAKHYVEEWA